ncbi:polyprenyl synthetase family protein [Embleya sp. NBC_00896]|uniref:polyprenyl synthetase family protein n=1 Tax=Embleya sp. NBC_00896 TaxID=2975961 RepID=UPI002F9191F2|nr:polyprenyl synthetase family protein [Embleya sp. NBC_00896]
MTETPQVSPTARKRRPTQRSCASGAPTLFGPPDPPIVDVPAVLAAEFARRWPRNADGLDAVYRYALLPTGKLLRPALVLYAALAVGGEVEHALPAAVGMECVHTGSLVHDDIIDADEERRGRPAVHVAFGPERAIIAGSSLYFAWFGALAECARHGVPGERIARAMAAQAEGGTAMCQGVFDELGFAGDLDCPVEDYLAMAARKTGALLATSCRVGAILGGGDDAAVEALGSFGRHLGLAFQIRDDLLPYDDASAAAMGKPADSDVSNHRPTLPVLLAHERGSAEQRAEIRDALLHESNPAIALARMRVLVETTGAHAETRALADRYEQSARDAIGWLPVNPYTDILGHWSRTEPTPTGT